MKRLLAAGTALTMAAVLVVPQMGSAQSNAPWPTFHGNQARSGSTPANGPTVSTAANAWTLPAAIESSPAVDPSGTAYVGSDDGKLYALSPTKPAAPLWSFATGGSTNVKGKPTPVISSPTLSNDYKTVFVGSDDGSVYAVDAAAGKQVWSVNIGGPVHGSPTLSADGTILYVASVNGTISALKSSDGTYVWQSKTVSLGTSIAGSLSLSPDGSTLYVATNNSLIYGIPVAGNQAGSPTPYYLEGPAISSPAIDGAGNIYVTTANGSVEAFVAGNSTARWIYDIPSRGGAFSTPAISNGFVVFGDNDQNIYGLSVSSGTPVWVAHTGGSVGSSPAIGANGVVYVGSDDGTIYALNLGTGVPVWEKPTGAAISSSPAIAGDGSLWIGNTSSTGGIMYRINVVTPPPTPQKGATSTPGATATPGPTSTPVPGTTPTATATGTANISVSLKSSVAPGSKQTIKVTTSPNTVVRFRVVYPNGTHQSHRGTSNASGVVTYRYTQGASKIKHNRFSATVIVKTGNAPNQSVAQAQYRIKFGKLDVSVEPPSAKVGQTVNVYVHTGVGKHVVAYLLFPSGKFVTRFGTTGPHGFVHIRYTIPRGTVSKGQKIKVIGKLQSASSALSSSANLTIK